MKLPLLVIMVLGKIKITPNTDKLLQAKKKYLVKTSIRKVRVVVIVLNPWVVNERDE